MNPNYQKRFIITVVLSIFVISGIVLPLILRIPLIKNAILFCLSFTKNLEYQIAYIEIWGVLIGTFLATYGTLWTQRKINNEEKRQALRNYACAVYYDLYFSFQELIKIHKETMHNHHIDTINGIETVYLFAQTAIGHELSFAQNWIDNLSHLSTELSELHFERIYKCYTKLENINRALRSKNPDEIVEIFVPDICWLVSGNEGCAHADIEQVLGALHAIKEGNNRKEASP